MSDLQTSAVVAAREGEAAPAESPQGVLGSLAFWICLLVAAGGYALATLAPTYVQNRQLAGEYAAAQAQVRGLVAQIDRYDRYCSRLTESAGTRDAVWPDGSTIVLPSTTPSSLPDVESHRWTAREGEGDLHAGRDGVRAPQQMALDESLQFQLDAVDVGETAAPQPAVSPVVALVSRSPLVRGMMRVLSAVLLLLALTLCLDSPAARPIPSAPRRSGEPWRIRHLQRWLLTRYRSRESAGRG